MNSSTLRALSVFCLLLSTVNESTAQDAVSFAAAELGKPYVYGAKGTEEFDCSSLTQYAYKRVGVTLPRTSLNQSSLGTLVSSPFQRGDLLFFETVDIKPGVVTHVGIYEGDNVMINANSYDSIVKRDTISDPYWSKRLLFGRRVNAPVLEPLTVTFSLATSFRTVREHGTLVAVVPSASSEALVTMVDLTEPGGGRSVVSREWHASSQGEALAIGDRTLTWGFGTSGPPTSYTITLSVQDNTGASGSASATLVVQAPTVFHSDDTPGISYGFPATDSAGGVYVVRSRTSTVCGFGFCGAAVEKIFPSSQRWTTGELSSDIYGRRRLIVAPDDTLYFEFERDGLYALSPAGEPIPGWPVRLVDQTGSGGRLFVSPPLIEPTTGMVFIAASPFTAFDFRPSVLVALDANGVERWRRESRELGTPFLGPAGNIYTLSGTQFVHHDRVSGETLCSNSQATLFHKAIGSKAGIFSSFRDSITTYRPDCTISRMFENTGRTDTVVQDARLGFVFAVDTPDPYVAGRANLLGVRIDDGFEWRNAQFSPTEIRAVYGSTLFVAGFEFDQPHNRRLFLVNALTGEVLQKIDLAGWCEGCDENMTIDRSGDLFFAGQNKVYRLRYPYF